MISARKRRASRGRGRGPTIACFDRTRDGLGADLGRLLRGLQRFVDRCVTPAWGTPARLVRSRGFVRGAWALVFLDNADKRGELGSHNLTPEGFPIAKVFVETANKIDWPLSVAASHELVEMLVDPGINRWTRRARQRTLYAYEAADPVNAQRFRLGGLPMSNFVYPSYFESFRNAGTEIGRAHV